MGKRSTAERQAGGLTMALSAPVQRKKNRRTSWIPRAIISLVFSFFLTYGLNAQNTSLPGFVKAQLDWPEIALSLSRRIANGSEEEKRSALFEIRNLRSEQASALALPALSDPSEIVRATAVSSITFLPAVQAIAALSPLLNDKAEFVRREAADALGKVGSLDAAGPLLSHLQREKIGEVRTVAVVALGRTGNTTAIEPLLRILKSRPKDEQEFLRRSAARSIGQIAQILRTGKAKVLTPENFLSRQYKDTASSLEDIAESRPVFGAAVVVLSQVLQNKNESADTRREAAFAIGSIGSRSSIYLLRTLQNDPDPYLAEICKEALLKIERPE